MLEEDSKILPNVFGGKLYSILFTLVNMNIIKTKKSLQLQYIPKNNIEIMEQES